MNKKEERKEEKKAVQIQHRDKAERREAEKVWIEGEKHGEERKHK